MTSELILEVLEVENKNKETCIVLFIYIYIYISVKKKKKKSERWSYSSVFLNFADGSKANQCKQMLHLTYRCISAAVLCEISDFSLCSLFTTQAAQSAALSYCQKTWSGLLILTVLLDPPPPLGLINEFSFLKLHWHRHLYITHVLSVIHSKKNHK